MNIKLVRNAMFITVIIMVISVMGKTSAHAAPSTMMVNNSTALVIER